MNSDKFKLLFDTLDNAAKDLKDSGLLQKSEETQSKPEKHSKYQNRHNRGELKKYKNKESLFKVPGAEITKALKPRRPPDYQVCEEMDPVSFL